MGLDTSHDCWHGAYSAFSRWRAKLAEVAGVPLGLMEGYFGWAFVGGEDEQKALRALPWDAAGMAIRELVAAAVGITPIRWDVMRPDVLHVLLDHSDCDGEIAAEHCGPLADRLEELIPLLPTGPAPGHIGDWRAKTRAFVDGLRLAASRGESVDFH